MSDVPPKLKKTKDSSREDLLKLDKDELVDRIIQLEAHNKQLKNIIRKNLAEGGKNETSKNNRPFDFAKCHFRKVLLRIMYFGWDYQGLAVQEDSNQTIEHHLFHALTKSCLIQSRETSQYHRCGRTDKGVSSFGQVITILLRSKHKPEDQYNEEAMATEMPYCKILNRLLPKEIRAVAWMPVPADKLDFSARFDCTSRLYRYYFPRGALSLSRMNDAASRLVGSHDFRHICKMDVGNGVLRYTREVLEACARPIEGDGPRSMCVMEMRGGAFLWHQVRCSMAVLMLVGLGREEPSVVDELLDVENHPRKPQYNMALDTPLNLFKCNYDVEDLWVLDKEELKSVIAHLQGEWTVHSIKTTMIADTLDQLEAEYSKLCAKERGDSEDNAKEEDTVLAYTDCLIQGVKPRVYTPLMKRQMCASLDEKIMHYKKKRKIADTEGSSLLIDS